MRVSSFPSFVRGDTVTIEVRTGLDLTHVASAVLVIEQCGYTITKEGDALEVSGGSVRGTLAPSESMTLIPGRVSVQLSLRFEDGTVFSSDPETWNVENRIGGTTGASAVLADAEFSAYVGIPVPAPHPDLEGRDLPDQHPIPSITGLEDALASKADGVATAQALASKADADETARAIEGRVGRDEFSRAMDGKADAAALTGETMQRVEGDTALRMLISDEVRDRRDAVSSEASARDAAVSSLSARIDRKQDRLTAGENVTIRDGVISAAGTEYGQATATAPGLMSASDKAKLDTVARGAEPNVIESVRVNGTPLSVTSDGAVNVDLSGYATKGDLSTIPKWDKVVVDELPTTGIQQDKIYLVPNSGSGINSRDEYIYVDGKWEIIGTTETDISGKQDVITGAASTVTSADLTAGRVVVSDSAGKIVADATTVAELHHLDGVKSNLQAQIDSEASARADAVDTLQKSIDTEISERKSAIASESSTRASAVSALDSSVVKLTEDQTITGLKTFNRTEAFKVSAIAPFVTMQATGIEKGVTGFQYTSPRIVFRDVNSNQIGLIGQGYSTTLDSTTSMMANNLVNGEEVSASLSVRVKSDGNRFAIAPTPSNVADNSEKIATTAWVNSASTVVHTTGNEIIAGEKRFTSKITLNSLEVINIHDEIIPEGGTPPATRQHYYHLYDAGYHYRASLYMGCRISDNHMGMRVYKSNTSYGGLEVRYDINSDSFTATAPATRASGYDLTDIATAGWADAKFVNLRDNQTVTGLKTFNRTEAFRVTAEAPYVTMQATGVERGVKGFSYLSPRIVMHDKNGANLGQFGNKHNTNLDTVMQITAFNIVNDAQTTADILLVCAKDGTKYATAPTPSDSADNTNKIATTTWVNSASTVVHTTGNETIAGSKTFTSTPMILNKLDVINIKHESLPSNACPTGTMQFYSYLRDAGDNTRCAMVMGSRVTDNHIALRVYDFDGSYGGVELRYDTTADAFIAIAPATRTSGYGSTDIATAGWVDTKIASQKSETWTFTLDDGSTVTKEVLVR